MSRQARAPRLTPDDTSVQHETSHKAWERLFGVPPARPDWFVEQAVAWQRQLLLHGDVTKAIQHDLNLAADAASERRANAATPAAPPSPAPASGAARATRAASALPPASSQLLAGTRLVKVHDGKTHVVEVTADGMLYEGALFGSLSAVAKHITGTHWNGLLFFGLRRRRSYPKAS